MPKNIKCLKCQKPMKSFLTKKGVLLDVCPHCKGVWFDCGEIYFFTKNKKTLRAYELKGLQNTKQIDQKCPKCHSEMQKGVFPFQPYEVEECLSCKGLFFDYKEVQKLYQSKNFSGLRRDKIPKDTNSRDKRSIRKISSIATTLKLPSLYLTASVACVSLYGLMVAFLIFIKQVLGLPMAGLYLSVFCLMGFQFYFGPIILDLQLKWFGSLSWRDIDSLPTKFKSSLLKLCAQNKLPIPKIGIIDDSSPQAYTYGRTPYSARVVFSKGMFELLDAEELEAVLAHELGHIKHWDFILMTIVQVIPIMLYTVYDKMYKIWDKKGGPINTKNNKSQILVIVGIVVAYICYKVSQYIVLFISRVREYHADRFSAFATKKPNKLLTALVKIAYGLLSSRPENKNKRADYEGKIKPVESMNIMNISRSKQISLIYQGKENTDLNPKQIEDTMKWDLWNPWAFYYELHSTHPLTAKRINALSSYARNMKQQPLISFKAKKPESYWDDFLKDCFILSLPYICAIGFLIWQFFSLEKNVPIKEFLSFKPFPKEHLILAVSFFSIGALIRTLKAYPLGQFRKYTISSLLKIIKVSPVCSYPVTINGYILGKGDAGNIFSEDLVLRDKTGMIFLNHEPIGFNIIFALWRYKRFMGKEVIVKGWYRRSPAPYIETSSIKAKNTKPSWAITYALKLALCVLGIILPIFISLFLGQ